MASSSLQLFKTSWFDDDLQAEYPARYEASYRMLLQDTGAHTPFTHVFFYTAKAFQEVCVYKNADAHFYLHRTIFAKAAHHKSESF